MKLICLSFLFVTHSLLAQETSKLDAKALEALKTAPVETKPQFIPKSASKGSVGPVRETERTYTFATKGSAQGKAARPISRTITRSDGTKTESALVDVPLLFEKDAATLANAQSQQNLDLLAKQLVDLQSSGAKFSVEGHASAEGDGVHNQKLSAERAKTVAAELGKRGVNQETLANIQGLGSAHSTQPADAAESQLAQDRRVLIVREK
jgi:outer membrane protein OmpA-like peptidoglycan-associated protein